MDNLCPSRTSPLIYSAMSRQPQKCSGRIESAIKTINLLLEHPYPARMIKAQFGLSNLKHNADFASLLQTPLERWQDKVWDPQVGSTAFDDF
ncbi:hypothetical protein APHAL10511_000451 [Amanita phalloides]|nr:hypothetical protein APHAL10511_000451 [Amanita phalloides]